ncbi:hypothetical protein PR048_021474 [Dryococelus australis]|uniref:Uncharacterized protein n=1 Tax=Dryococelus australis TaxID=614101 RepID=A0ABQ9GYA0_9NEOP|nr:hypothetical protein PR048_021474 [Dryococelus australis]
MSACTRQKAKSKYINRIGLERASQKSSRDTHETPYDRVKRCRERKINIKASERVNVDVFTQNKRPRPRHTQKKKISPLGLGSPAKKSPRMLLLPFILRDLATLVKMKNCKPICSISSGRSEPFIIFLRDILRRRRYTCDTSTLRTRLKHRQFAVTGLTCSTQQLPKTVLITAHFHFVSGKRAWGLLRTNTCHIRTVVRLVFSRLLAYSETMYATGNVVTENPGYDVKNKHRKQAKMNETKPKECLIERTTTNTEANNSGRHIEVNSDTSATTYRELVYVPVFLADAGAAFRSIDSRKQLLPQPGPHSPLPYRTWPVDCAEAKVLIGGTRCATFCKRTWSGLPVVCQRDVTRHASSASRVGFRRQHTHSILVKGCSRQSEHFRNEPYKKSLPLQACISTDAPSVIHGGIHDCIQVELKQGFQRSSFYLEQPTQLRLRIVMPAAAVKLRLTQNPNDVVVLLMKAFLICWLAEQRTGNKPYVLLPRRDEEYSLFFWQRGRGGVVDRLLASHLVEPSSPPGRGRSQIFARGNRAGRCRWSEGFLEAPSFPPPLEFQRYSILNSLHPHRLLRRYYGNTVRLARRSDEALEERVSVARIAPTEVHPNLKSRPNISTSRPLGNFVGGSCRDSGYIPPARFYSAVTCNLIEGNEKQNVWFERSLNYWVSMVKRPLTHTATVCVRRKKIVMRQGRNRLPLPIGFRALSSIHTMNTSSAVVPQSPIVVRTRLSTPHSARCSPPKTVKNLAKSRVAPRFLVPRIFLRLCYTYRLLQQGGGGAVTPTRTRRCQSFPGCSGERDEAMSVSSWGGGDESASFLEDLMFPPLLHFGAALFYLTESSSQDLAVKSRVILFTLPSLVKHDVLRKFMTRRQEMDGSRFESNIRHDFGCDTSPKLTRLPPSNRQKKKNVERVLRRLMIEETGKGKRGEEMNLPFRGESTEDWQYVQRAERTPNRPAIGNIARSERAERMSPGTADGDQVATPPGRAASTGKNCCRRTFFASDAGITTFYVRAYSTRHGTGLNDVSNRRIATLKNQGTIIVENQFDRKRKLRVAYNKLVGFLQNYSPSNIVKKKLGLAVLRTRPFVLREYVYVNALGRHRWTLRKAEVLKLRAFEMWCWRRLLRIPWTDKVTNGNVFKRANETRILVENLNKRRNSFICHVLRHSVWCTTLCEGKLEDSTGGHTRVVFCTTHSFSMLGQFESVPVRHENLERIWCCWNDLASPMCLLTEFQGGEWIAEVTLLQSSLHHFPPLPTHPSPDCYPGLPAIVNFSSTKAGYLLTQYDNIDKQRQGINSHKRSSFPRHGRIRRFGNCYLIQSSNRDHSVRKHKSRIVWSTLWQWIRSKSQAPVGRHVVTSPDHHIEFNPLTQRPFIQDSKLKTQDHWLKNLDSRLKIIDPRHKTLSSRLNTQDSKYKTQDPLPNTQDSRLKTQNSNTLTQDP